MTPDVVAVKPLAGYQLETDFANGERRLFDLRPYLDYHAFAALAEASLFMRAHVALGTVAWTDEIDISPDTLYLRGAPLPTVVVSPQPPATAEAFHLLTEGRAQRRPLTNDDIRTAREAGRP